MSRGSGQRKWQPHWRAQSILWLTALEVKPHFASRRAGKILIASSDCAQHLRAKSWVSSSVRRLEILQADVSDLHHNVLFRSTASTLSTARDERFKARRVKSKEFLR
jgi:hypothetical protein